MRSTKESLKSFAVMSLWLLSLLVMGQTRATSQANPITIPFEMNRGRIYVDAFVNQRGPFRFMVDTGASGYGRVDAKLVKDLNLATTGTASTSDGIHTATVSTLKLDSLRVGEITRRNLDIFSRDYSALFRSDTRPIMGIIGFDYFSNALLTIDYAKSELVVSEGSLNAAEPNVLRYDTDPIIPLRIGEHETTGFLDTGSSAEMHLPMEWAKRLGVQNLREAGEGRRANSTFKMFMAESPVTVEIGSNRVVVTAPMFSEATERIIIGARFLENHRCILTLDHRQQRMRIVANPQGKPQASGAKTDSTLSQYLGKYGERTITFEDGLLFLQRAGGARLRLHQIGEGILQINLAGPEKPILTFKKENGRITGYSIKGPDGNDLFIEKDK